MNQRADDFCQENTHADQYKEESGMNLKNLLSVGLMVSIAAVAQPQLIERRVSLFQAAPAELWDRYQLSADSPWRLRDLPAQPLVGSCDVPNAQVRSLDYPILDASLARGQQINLYVKDPRLGPAIQQAEVVWRQPPQYGLRLLQGPAADSTLTWSPASDWAEVRGAPEDWPGLEVDARLPRSTARSALCDPGAELACALSCDSGWRPAAT